MRYPQVTIEDGCESHSPEVRALVLKHDVKVLIDASHPSGCLWQSVSLRSAPNS